jgi:hypothetical protein
MPKLKFVSLVCHRPDDISEADDHMFDGTIEDEPYILVNHTKVWDGRRMAANDVEDLSGVEPINFNEDVRVELWDQDAGYISDDDQIGRLEIKAHQEGLGELKHEFKRKQARYTLTYKVE